MYYAKASETSVKSVRSSLISFFNYCPTPKRKLSGIYLREPFNISHYYYVLVILIQFTSVVDDFSFCFVTKY